MSYPHDYRLTLNQRSTSGMGSVILNDVLTTVGDIEDTGFSLTESLNEPTTLEFTLPLDHGSVTTDNFAVGEREVYLYRNSGAGEQLVFGGRLWTVDVEGWTGRFICYDWLFELERRVIIQDATFVSADAWDVAWALVSASQTRGSIGLTRGFGTLGASVDLFAVCLEEQKGLMDAIRDMAESEGTKFDYAVTPNKVLNFYAPQRGGSTPVALNDENMTTFAHTRDATVVETSVGVTGPPEESCQIPTIYKPSANVTKFGVLDGIVDKTFVPSQSLREGLADAKLDVSQNIAFVPRVTMQAPLQDVNVENSTGYDVYWDDVGLGDVVAVSTSSEPPGGFRNFNGSFRVTKKKLEAKRPGLETVSFDLDSSVV